MKLDLHPSDALRLPQDAADVADLPPKRKWFGYAAVAASLAITSILKVLWNSPYSIASSWFAVHRRSWRPCAPFWLKLG